jgi:hypothetical protein
MKTEIFDFAENETESTMRGILFSADAIKITLHYFETIKLMYDKTFYDGFKSFEIFWGDHSMELDFKEVYRVIFKSINSFYHKGGWRGTYLARFSQGVFEVDTVKITNGIWAQINKIK